MQNFMQLMIVKFLTICVANQALEKWGPVRFEQMAAEEEKISNGDMTDAFSDLSTAGLRDSAEQWSSNVDTCWSQLRR